MGGEGGAGGKFPMSPLALGESVPECPRALPEKEKFYERQMQQSVRCCNILRYYASLQIFTTRCGTLRCTATVCNTLR